MSTIIDLDRDAVTVSMGIVERAGRSDLTRPTPCTGWTLADLLDHMTTQHRGFAASARGNVDDVSVWSVVSSPDPVAAHLDSAADVMEAFAAVDPDAGMFWLPEVLDGGPFPASMAVAFHLVDYVVHGWDVAVSLGGVADYPGDVLATALEVAQLVPDGAERDEPSAAFAHALPGPDAASTLEQILRQLGRDPAWTPAAVSR
jgi:uncharacterized protein (TIGR03086 family)